MPFDIVQVLQDPESARSWVEEYKAFRLHSLQTAPEAFASTYAREVVFTDDIWHGRLTNPEAATCLALDSGRIVSTLTILGPLPIRPEDVSPSANPGELKSGGEQAQLHYRINAMFTLPAARGQGVAKALIAKAKKFAITQAGNSGKDLVVTIAVEKENLAARSLYGKCGFLSFKEEAYSFHGQARDVILMRYDP